jgi:hypothetical protein
LEDKHENLVFQVFKVNTMDVFVFAQYLFYFLDLLQIFFE